MIEDIELKVKELKLENQHIILPSTFLDLYGFDLMGRNIIDFMKTTPNDISIIK
jgi:hypothetical protein